MTLTEREMLIAKIGLLEGLVASKKSTPKKASQVLKNNCEMHGFNYEDALNLEAEIDQMFGDSTLI